MALCRVEITPQADDNFTKAQFSYWQPDHQQELRALLILVPGANDNGLSLADDPSWQAFADSNNLAMIACYFASSASPLASGDGDDATPLLAEDYCIAKQGSGSALLTAIRQIANIEDNDHIAKLPLLMWGYSAGGQFNYSFSCMAPEKVLGFVAIKGGVYQDKPDAKLLTIPALFIAGENDLPERKGNINKLVDELSEQGANWCLAIQPNSGHELTGDEQELVCKFFNGLLTNQESNNETAWSVDPKQYKINKQRGRTKAKNRYWVPNKATADAWLRFSHKDTDSYGAVVALKD